MKIRALITACALASVTGVMAPAEAATVKIFMSNFHFCQRSIPAGDNQAEGVCLPTDEDHVTTVAAGESTTLVFEYDDALCDAIQVCPGHNARGGVGFTGGAGAGQKTNFSVTKTFAAGDHPYICTVHGDFGMSGIIRAT